MSTHARSTRECLVGEVATMKYELNITFNLISSGGTTAPLKVAMVVSGQAVPRIGEAVFIPHLDNPFPNRLIVSGVDHCLERRAVSRISVFTDARVEIGLPTQALVDLTRQKLIPHLHGIGFELLLIP